MKDLELSMPAEYQVENATLAIETILNLKKFGFEISETHIRHALKTSFFPGRFELLRYKILNTKYQILLDGAHNPEKMHAIITSLQKVYPHERKVFLLAFKEDKNIKEMLKEIIPVADVIICTEFSSEVYVSNQKAMKAESIKYKVLSIKYAKKKNIIIEPDLKKALDILLSQLQQNSSLGIVTGSLYLVGEVRGKLKNL